jgi:hypothetical protein
MDKTQPDYLVARKAVLNTFFSARAAGCSACKAYKAGVDVWRRLYPDQSPEYSALAAVKIMLEAVKGDLLTADVLDHPPTSPRAVARSEGGRVLH